MPKDQLAHGAYYLAKLGGIARWETSSQRFYQGATYQNSLESYTIEEFEPIDRAWAERDSIPFSEIVLTPEYLSNKR